MTWFVTSNEHKFQEISRMLSAFGITIKWKKMKYEEIQADTTEEISMDSAKKLAQVIQEPFFLEDTGLYIESLGGFPGPYSSFVSKTVGNEGTLRLLDCKDRKAKFITVITYHDERGFMQFEGTLTGRISERIQGGMGFGFDPIFIPEGINQTLAELSMEEKNKISHRAKAVKRLIEFLPEK